MKLFLGKKVGVSKEEKALSYYKFFERDMANIPAEKIALLDAPQEKSAVPFEEKNLYLAGKDKDYAQVGYGTAANGTGFVCNETYMPGVTQMCRSTKRHGELIIIFWRMWVVAPAF